MEFEWNIFPGFNTLQLSQEVKSLRSRLGETPKNSQEGLSSCRCSTTSPVDSKTTKKNASHMLDSFLCMQRELEQDNGHLLVQVARRSDILSVQTVHKVNGTESLN